MAVDPLLCSREELLVLLAGQTVVIEGLEAQVENLRALVVELRRRLDADSSNSSRPPSSDSPFRRPPPKTSAMPPEDDGPARKRGKQRGAAGKNRRQVDNPDEQIGVEPLGCSGCGAGLACDLRSPCVASVRFGVFAVGRAGGLRPVLRPRGSSGSGSAEFRRLGGGTESGTESAKS